MGWVKNPFLKRTDLCPRLYCETRDLTIKKSLMMESWYKDTLRRKRVKKGVSKGKCVRMEEILILWSVFPLKKRCRKFKADTLRPSPSFITVNNFLASCQSLESPWKFLMRYAPCEVMACVASNILTPYVTDIFQPWSKLRYIWKMEIHKSKRKPKTVVLYVYCRHSK